MNLIAKLLQNLLQWHTGTFWAGFYDTSRFFWLAKNKLFCFFLIQYIHSIQGVKWNYNFSCKFFWIIFECVNVFLSTFIQVPRCKARRSNFGQLNFIYRHPGQNLWSFYASFDNAFYYFFSYFNLEKILILEIFWRKNELSKAWHGFVFATPNWRFSTSELPNWRLPFYIWYDI